MFVDMKLSLFSCFTPKHKNIIQENYNYYSVVTNLVLYAHSASTEIKYMDNVGNMLLDLRKSPYGGENGFEIRAHLVKHVNFCKFFCF